MTIYVVEPGDTIESIANEFGVNADRLVIENGIPNPEDLVVEIGRASCRERV